MAHATNSPILYPLLCQLRLARRPVDEETIVTDLKFVNPGIDLFYIVPERVI